jgi:diguanylate cyclase
MIQKGQFTREDIHILHPLQVPGFNALLSTRLYPEWPLAITRYTDRNLARKVVMALYSLPFNDPILSSVGIAGWTIPYDYTPVHDLMRELKVGPYKNLGQIQIKDVVRQYWPWVFGLGLMLAGMVVVHSLRLLKLVHESRQSLRNTLYSIGDAVITTDVLGRVEFVNPAAERLLAMSREDMIGKPYEPIVSLSYEYSGESIGDVVTESLERDAPYTIAENIQHSLDNGDQYSIKLTTAPIISDSGHASGCVLVLHDVTDMQHMTQKLRYQASHDPLTDLYNRREFEQLLLKAIYRVKRYKVPVSLLYLDLDNFKIVNDSSGHFVGDEMLKQVAQLLRSRLRESDLLARLGGDEFGILLDNCQLPDAQQIASKIHDAMDGFRFQWDEHIFRVGVSIGIVPLRLDSEPSIVMSEADAACYVAKAHGRNRYHIYQVDDSEVMHHHGEVAWVQRISHAFEDDRFELYCQPIM